MKGSEGKLVGKDMQGCGDAATFARVPGGCWRDGGAEARLVGMGAGFVKLVFEEGGKRGTGAVQRSHGPLQYAPCDLFTLCTRSSSSALLMVTSHASATAHAPNPASIVKRCAC